MICFTKIKNKNDTSKLIHSFVHKANMVLDHKIKSKVFEEDDSLVKYKLKAKLQRMVEVCH